MYFAERLGIHAGFAMATEDFDAVGFCKQLAEFGLRDGVDPKTVRKSLLPRSEMAQCLDEGRSRR